MSSIFEVAKIKISEDHVTKSLDLYAEYDKYIHAKKINPKFILEIGVYKGESTKIIAAAFPDAKIVAVDYCMYEINFEKYENVIYLKVDQTNKNQLMSLISVYFPDGIDLVIEDASHIGYYSKITFDVVFPYVRNGGAYFIEDYATGYMGEWFDGKTPQIERFANANLRPAGSGFFNAKFFEYLKYQLNQNNLGRKIIAFAKIFRKKINSFPMRFPSHDYGMVGFVKSLVDKIHKNGSGIREIQFTAGACMVLKGDTK